MPCGRCNDALCSALTRLAQCRAEGYTIVFLPMEVRYTLGPITVQTNRNDLIEWSTASGVHDSCPMAQYLVGEIQNHDQVNKRWWADHEGALLVIIRTLATPAPDNIRGELGHLEISIARPRPVKEYDGEYYSALRMESDSEGGSYCRSSVKESDSESDSDAQAADHVLNPKAPAGHLDFGYHWDAEVYTDEGVLFR